MKIEEALLWGCGALIAWVVFNGGSSNGSSQSTPLAYEPPRSTMELLGDPSDDRQPGGADYGDDDDEVERGDANVDYAMPLADLPQHGRRWFHGRPCTQDCSGHEAGYAWAARKGITSPLDCSGNSRSFVSGCEVYAEERQLGLGEVEEVEEAP
jgi:hypothetical protein